MTKPQPSSVPRRCVTALLLFTLALALISKVEAGWFFNDPLEIAAHPVKHVFAKDELHFSLKGKCASWFVFHPQVTLELKTSEGVRKLDMAQQFWATNSPIVFKLPIRYSEVHSVTLKGTFSILGKVKANPKGKYSTDNGARFDLIPIHGYKIDSRWTTK